MVLKMAANLSNYLSDFVATRKNVSKKKIKGRGLPPRVDGLLQYNSKSVFESGRRAGLEACSNLVWQCRIPIPTF